MRTLQTVVRRLMLSANSEEATKKRGPKVDGRTEFKGQLPRVDDTIKVDLKILRTKLTNPDIIKALEDKGVDTKSITQETKPNGSIVAYDPNNEIVAVKKASGEIIEFLTIWMVREKNVRVGFSCAINLRAEQEPSSLNDSPEKRLASGREKFGGTFSTN